MESWAWTCVILCLFGFFKDFKPSEPFLTQYLISPQWVNITLSEAYTSVYPIWTYSYLAVLVFVFILTDWVRYKPMIIFEGLAYVTTWILLVFGSGVQLMQFMQVAYGIATATEISYYSYIYAKVHSDKYQMVTSFTRVAILMGIFLSSSLGQLLTSYELVDFRQLNIISLCSVCLATFISILLPKVKNSIYFHVARDQAHDDTQPNQNVLVSAIARLKSNFFGAFSQGPVFTWSLWWALGMCSNYQVGNFIQPLWETLHQDSNHSNEQWNGAVEATSTLLGAALAFAFAFIKLNWALVGEILLVFISILDGIILISMGVFNSIWVAYVGYLLFRPLFQMLITIASFEIARQIKPDSCGLVFGVNTFFALAFQSILTLVVVEYLELSPQPQFVVHGGFCIFVGIFLLLIFIGRECQKGDWISRMKEEGIWESVKQGKEDDVESRQLSLAGAVEATK